MTDVVLSVIHDTKERIDPILDSGDITSLVLRLEYLNRTIVNRGELPDSIVSTIRQVIALLRDLDHHLSTGRGTERNVAESAYRWSGNALFYDKRGTTVVTHRQWIHTDEPDVGGCQPGQWRGGCLHLVLVFQVRKCKKVITTRY